MSKIVCTYEDYDKMCEKFRIMRFQAEDYAPTLWDFSEYIEKNPAKYIDFLIWIDVTGITTEENKEARKWFVNFYVKIWFWLILWKRRKQNDCDLCRKTRYGY